MTVAGRLLQDCGASDPHPFGTFKRWAHNGQADKFVGKAVRCVSAWMRASCRLLNYLFGLCGAQEELNALSRKKVAAILSVAAKYGQVETVEVLLDELKKSTHVVSCGPHVSMCATQ